MNPKAKPSRNVRNFKKTIRTNTKRLSCIYYKNKTYLLCSSLYNIKITDSRAPAIWTCSKCYFRELSFISLRDIECVNESTDLPSSATYYVNTPVGKLKEYHEHPEAATGGFLLKKVFLVRKIHRKTPVSESLF